MSHLDVSIIDSVVLANESISDHQKQLLHNYCFDIDEDTCMDTCIASNIATHLCERVCGVCAEINKPVPKTLLEIDSLIEQVASNIAIVGAQNISLESNNNSSFLLEAGTQIIQDGEDMFDVGSLDVSPTDCNTLS